MKKPFLFILCILLCMPLYAQRERNYIYLFDCTQSMRTVVNIWEPTKKYLKDDIEKLSSSSTISIIPFQNTTYPTIQFQRKNFNWNKIEEQFNKYIENKTNTNICSAWDEGVKWIDTNKDNYFFILTDGEDNVEGTKELCKRIHEWCGKYRNSYAFYLMLTEKAKEKEKEIAEAIGTCNTIRLIDTKGHISPFGIFEEETITTNTLDIEKQIKIPFSTVGKYTASANSTDSLFNITLVNNVILDGKALFKISKKKSEQEITAILNGKDSYSFPIEVKAIGVDILNPKLTINVINKLERILTLVDEEEIDIGQASYYPAFLFWKESKQDTLFYDLNLFFNQPAIQNASSVTFKVSTLNHPKDYRILMNGILCPNNQFIVDNKMQKSILSIIFNKDAEQGKRYFSIVPIQIKEIDRINTVPAKDYQLSIRTKYSVKYNPLLIILLCLLIILAILLTLWFSIIKTIIYPKVKLGRIIINEPYYKVKNIHHSRNIIFTNKRVKQGVLSRIFTGRTVYEINEIWSDPIEFEPCKRSLTPITKCKYNIIPFSTRMEKNTEYEIQNIATNQLIKITIN